MESTCVFTSSKIHNDKDRAAYVKAMRRCYYTCSEECNGSNLSGMLKDLIKLNRDVPRTFRPRIEIFSDVKKHYMLGIHHSIDIVSTLNRRFITGDSHPETTFVRSILGDRRDEM